MRTLVSYLFSLVRLKKYSEVVQLQCLRGFHEAGIPVYKTACREGLFCSNLSRKLTKRIICYLQEVTSCHATRKLQQILPISFQAS